MEVVNHTTTGAAGRTRNRIIARSAKYFSLALVALLVTLAFAGLIFQHVSSARDFRAYIPPGVFVEVSGYKMHLYCDGPRESTPAVILESGLNDSWLSWFKVQPPIAKFARVCSYDRAGVGWSDAQPGEPDSQTISLRLHSLLRNAGIKPPYILVGHSSAGLHVRVFQKMYPAEVSGIVLLDASHPDEMNRMPPQIAVGRSKRRFKFELLKLTMPFGIPRLTGRCGDGPAEIKNLLRTAQCRRLWMETQEAEFDAFDKSVDESRAAASLGSLPLMVLSHDPKIGGRPGVLPADIAERSEIAWARMQEELSRLSTSGSHIVAQGSAHYIQFDRPDLVVDAVHFVVDASRNGPAANSQPKTISNAADSPHKNAAGRLP
jgi:pimeloyl-ACP methyl ester carboxylesterase